MRDGDGVREKEGDGVRMCECVESGVGHGERRDGVMSDCVTWEYGDGTSGDVMWEYGNGMGGGVTWEYGDGTSGDVTWGYGNEMGAGVTWEYWDGTSDVTWKYGNETVDGVMLVCEKHDVCEVRDGVKWVCGDELDLVNGNGTSEGSQ